jgi:hypothetical protein
MTVETLFGDGDPAYQEDGSWGNPLSIGMSVVFATDGFVLGGRTWVAPTPGIWVAGYYTSRFYSVDAGDTPGTGAGTLLASKDFGAVPGSTWITVLYDTPVPVTAGVLYRTVVGSDDNYVANFSTPHAAPIVSGNITAPAAGATVNGMTIRQTAITGTKTNYPKNPDGYGGPGTSMLVTDLLFEASAGGGGFDPKQAAQFLTFF